MSKAGDGDKRTVATDALMTLGTIIGPSERRDAIHLAVEPVIAGEALMPGEHVTVSNGIATGTEDGHGLGIVDPFLPGVVTKGERFWFVMYPRQVHSLRHVWTHPAFPDVDAVSVGAPDKAASEKWLRNFCDTNDCPEYEYVVAAAAENDDPYSLRLGRDATGEIPGEFWDHVEIVTGKKPVRADFFSCSC